ncbi:MAG TPA: hypothetical protein ENH95_02980 [Nitrosopumilus sp.]|nr:hypothetical protein [Nitrosopumilus sp.]
MKSSNNPNGIKAMMIELTYQMREVNKKQDLILQEEMPELKKDVAVIKEKVHSIKGYVSNHLTDAVKAEEKYNKRLQLSEGKIAEIQTWKNKLEGKLIILGAIAAIIGSIIGGILLQMF